MDRIPDEVLFWIIGLINHKFLPALAATAKRYYRRVIPILYRFVQTTTSAHDYTVSFRHDLPPDLSWALDPLQRTTIYKQRRLIRTLENSSALRSYVVGIGLDTRRDPKRWKLNLNEKVMNIQLITMLHLTLKYIHLGAGEYEELILDLAPITSLSINMYNLEEHLEYTLRGAFIPFNTLYTIFELPSLRVLRMLGTMAFQDTELEEERLKNRAATSNISSLNLTLYELSASKLESFAEVLTWPKALRVFHLAITNCLEEAHSAPEHIIEAVAPHRASLEELCIDYITWPTEADKMGPLGLHAFSRLKKLSLPSKYLASSDDQISCSEGWELLPPNLEELQIRIPESFDYGSPGDFGWPTQEAAGLVCWLKTLTDLRKTAYPRLSKVAIVHPIWLSKDPFAYPIDPEAVNYILDDWGNKSEEAEAELEDEEQFRVACLERIGALAGMGDAGIAFVASAGGRIHPPLMRVCTT